MLISHRFLCMCLIINICSIVYHMYVRVNMNYTRQQIFVYLFFLVFLDVFGVADADFGVSFRVVSTVSKIFATN